MNHFRKFVAALVLSLMLAPVAGSADTIDRKAPGHTLKTQFQKQNALNRVTTDRLSSRRRGQRFVEFRGEMVYFPGNTVLRHGFLGADGEPDEYEAVAFQASHGPIGMLVGNIVPYPSKLGVYPWDDVTPALQTYRVKINKRQHQRLIALIKRTRAEKKLFYLYTDNCVRFVRDAARTIGLKAPNQTFILPPIYVNMLRLANQ